jgi:hypothetical protein
MDVLTIGRFLRHFGELVDQLVVQGIEIRHVLLGTSQNPDRLAAPFNGDAFARLQLADIHFHRCTGRLGACTGIHGGDERNRNADHANCTHHAGGSKQKPASALINAIGTH